MGMLKQGNIYITRFLIRNEILGSRGSLLGSEYQLFSRLVWSLKKTNYVTVSPKDQVRTSAAVG